MRVLWTLNVLTWHCIDEEKDDESLMGAEIVSWEWNFSALFPKYECIDNWVMKPPLKLALGSLLKMLTLKGARVLWILKIHFYEWFLVMKNYAQTMHIEWFLVIKGFFRDEGLKKLASKNRCGPLHPSASENIPYHLY
jgi:hypothetical protein